MIILGIFGAIAEAIARLNLQQMINLKSTKGISEPV